MSDQTIFGGSTPQPTPSPVTQEDYTDLLSLVRNENGEPKYKTVKDALIGLQNAQSFIQTLKTEKSQIEQEVSSLRPVAEKVTELERVVASLSTPRDPVATPTAGLSEEAVAQLVEQTLTKRQRDEAAKTNIATVTEAVRKAFGDKAEEAFYGKAQQLGLSKEDINALAARTPQAVLELIGIKQNAPSFHPTSSSVNTAGINPTQNSFISRNPVRLEVGATAQELLQETVAAKRMVEELNEKGMSIDDLVKPSNYFKYFK